MTDAELSGIFRPEPLPAGWTVEAAAPADGWENGYAVAYEGGHVGLVSTRHTLTSRLKDAYPVGARDLEITSDAQRPEPLQLVTGKVFEADPGCRRIVLGVPAGDVAAIDAGERAGYRYVVDVDLFADKSLSLLVAEPEWVLSQPTAIESLPQT
ncbi:hypothetical protein GCM10027418_18560 [Mariniluteicoccus endophyticus]